MKHQIKIDNSGVSLTGWYPSRSYDLIYSAVSRNLTRGLPSPIQTDETRKAHSRDPGSSATRLAPRALSTGVVDSFGEGLFGSTSEVWPRLRYASKTPMDVYA